MAEGSSSTPVHGAFPRHNKRPFEAREPSRCPGSPSTQNSRNRKEAISGFLSRHEPALGRSLPLPPLSGDPIGPGHTQSQGRSPRRRAATEKQRGDPAVRTQAQPEDNHAQDLADLDRHRAYRRNRRPGPRGRYHPAEVGVVTADWWFGLGALLMASSLMAIGVVAGLLTPRVA